MLAKPSKIIRSVIESSLVRLRNESNVTTDDMAIMEQHNEEEQGSEFQSTEEYLKQYGKVLEVRFDSKSENVRQIYFSEHKVPSRIACKEKPVGRTLILSKIPPWATTDAIKRVLRNPVWSC